MKFCVVYS